MSDATLAQSLPEVAIAAAAHRPDLDAKPHFAGIIVFAGLLLAGVLFTLYGLTSDMSESGAQPLAIGAFVLLGVALLIALGFEFVNGFHDTANAVATVIYTHSMPAQVAVESGGQLEPIVAPTWDHRPHRAIGDQIDVEVDQRAAYLASAVQVELGHGPPRELQRISTSVFDEQKPPFGLWRIAMPAAGDLDGLTKRLPLPHPAMRWDAPVTVWVTTRAVQHLSAPVELGGAGLSVAELDIDAAWVWPQQGRMLRTWADVLRAKLIEAREADREDYQDFIKGIYTTYLGRMSTDKWGPQQRSHQQPAWYAAIRADTRWRALRYARRIADTHGLYPISAELDAWVYRIDPDVDPQILAEDSTANGKYRVKWTSADTGEGAPA